DVAEREGELPVGAAVLERVELAVVPAIERDRGVPERDLDRPAATQRPVVLDGIPVVGIEPRRSRALPAASRVGKRRRRDGRRLAPGRHRRAHAPERDDAAITPRRTKQSYASRTAWAIVVGR